MFADHQKRNLPVHTSRLVPLVLAMVSLLALTLASAWLARTPAVTPAAAPAVAPAARVSANRYLGVVQLAPDDQGRCEQLEFDNRAGVLRWKGLARCDDVTSAARSVPSRGPLQNVGGYFRSH